MNPDDLSIRQVLPGDNQGIGDLIRGVLKEFGVPDRGTTLADPSLDCIYETYQVPRASYWVVAGTSGIWGGAGLAPLEGAQLRVCELQKMYLREEIRGQGWGGRLLRKILGQAANLGYTKCYLETMPYMEASQYLYAQYGFRRLQAPLGQTGHSACTVWMEKTL